MWGIIGFSSTILDLLTFGILAFDNLTRSHYGNWSLCLKSCGYVSILLLGGGSEGSEATEANNKYANFSKLGNVPFLNILFPIRIHFDFVLL